MGILHRHLHIPQHVGIEQRHSGARGQQAGPGIRFAVGEHGEQNTALSYVVFDNVEKLRFQSIYLVEAAARSGALITASFAAEQGRDVFAVPGSVFSLRSQGTNELLRQGAAPACSADDILQALDFELLEARQEITAAIPETLAEATLLAGLEAEPRHADELGREAGLPAAEVAATFAVLELKGLARHVGGMWYVRA